jgi:hypothetical protein
MLPMPRIAATAVSFEIGGWNVRMATMPGVAEFLRGYYLIDYRTFSSAVVGVLDVFGDGHACDSPNKWFVIDDVSYVAGALTLLAGRFEYRCGIDGAALHGAFRWVK